MFCSLLGFENTTFRWPSAHVCKIDAIKACASALMDTYIYIYTDKKKYKHTHTYIYIYIYIYICILPGQSIFNYGAVFGHPHPPFCDVKTPQLPFPTAPNSHSLGGESGLGPRCLARGRAGCPGASNSFLKPLKTRDAKAE